MLKHINSRRGTGDVMYEINLVEIYISNLMGFLLMVGVYLGNAWKMKKKNSEDRVLLRMILTVMISCVIDPIAYTVNGMQGGIFWWLNYICNFWSYAADLIIGPAWIAMIKMHVSGTDEKFHRNLVMISSTVGCLSLLINFIHPLIFWVDENNIYCRGPLFWLFPAVGAMYIIDGIVVYLIGRARGSILRFFPVMQFFLPVVIGLVIQIMFVGITMIWPGLAIGMTTMIISLQNENIFKDRLTGLMNRFYLDKIEGELKQHQAFGLMMLDMNDFKSINDQYGHSEGDQALIAMGSILRKTVWVHGTVIRYAGDEFVILLYADREEFLESFRNLINQNIEEYNNRSGKGYRLSVSVGYGIFNLEKDTMDDIMKLVDQRMYEDKRRYYEENPQRERRHAIKNEEST